MILERARVYLKSRYGPLKKKMKDKSYIVQYSMGWSGNIWRVTVIDLVKGNTENHGNKNIVLWDNRGGSK